MLRPGIWTLISVTVLCGCVVDCRLKGKRVLRQDCPTSAKPSDEVASFLWTVVRNPPSYLFGTIHVPYSMVWDSIDDNVKMAFQRSDTVFFELDLTNNSTISALMHCQLLPHGVLLRDVLPQDMYFRLLQHLSYIRLILPDWIQQSDNHLALSPDELYRRLTANWHRKRPIWIVLMLNALSQSEIQSRGTPLLDLYLAREAERLQKDTGAVEDVKDQCEPLNQLNTSQVLFTLNYTLSYAEWQREGQAMSVHPYTTEQLIQHYKCIELNSLLFSRDTTQVSTLFTNLNVSLTTAENILVEEIDAYFNEQLIHYRNQKMAEKVATLLKEDANTSFFFAFGAGHFIGNGSVLELLSRQGFIIENNSPNEAVFLGTDYIQPPLIPLLADLPTNHPLFGATAVLSISHNNIRRNRHREERWKRRRNHLQPPDGVSHDWPTTPPTARFNDLWVRLERQRLEEHHQWSLWYSQSTSQQQTQSVTTSHSSSSHYVLIHTVLVCLIIQQCLKIVIEKAIL